MINSSGGFNDTYEVPNNRIAFCRKDLDHLIAALPDSQHYFLERQTKQTITELANAFLEELLDSNSPPEGKDPRKYMEFLMRNLTVKFPDPELKAKAQQLYEEQLKKEGNQQWLSKISIF